MQNEIEIVMTFGSSKVSEKLKTAGIDDETLDRKVNDILEKESLKRKKLMDYYEIEVGMAAAMPKNSLKNPLRPRFRGRTLYA